MSSHNIIYIFFFDRLGSTCNHVAAVLFKIDWAWKSGMTSKSCTSKPCVWSAFGAKGKVVDQRPVSELEWRKPHHGKGGKCAFSLNFTLLI
jgi:hypothetical protein